MKGKGPPCVEGEMARDATVDGNGCGYLRQEEGHGARSRSKGPRLVGLMGCSFRRPTSR